MASTGKAPYSADVPAQDATSSPDTGVEELSPSEAVATFSLSEATLRRLLAAGELEARKVSGIRGREWRIPVSALERAGYTRRPAPTDEDAVPRAELRRLQEALASERARASQLDSQLGYALLTIGRLRGRLCQAGIDPDELFGADLAASASDTHDQPASEATLEGRSRSARSRHAPAVR